MHLLPEEVAEIRQRVMIVQGGENSNQWIAQFLNGGRAVVGPSPIAVAQTIYMSKADQIITTSVKDYKTG
jgi:hypothetical protein